MYRDAWRAAFSDKRTHSTHQARLIDAREKVQESNFVVFGGGGLLYNSLGRDNGMAELKILNQWHDILRETETPYAFASIGFQPKDFDLDSNMSLTAVDGGIFEIVHPFIHDAVFITAR